MLSLDHLNHKRFSMGIDTQQFEQRKLDHIQLALLTENQATEGNELDRVHLMHDALPDLDLNAICLEGVRFSSSIPKPFIVSSMTAGHRGAVNINQNLMQACVAHQWAMGVGSQRRELSDKNAAKEWNVLRKAYPDACLYGNLGIAQLIITPMDAIRRLCDALQASALIIHCNPLQESVQPEGTPQFKGCWNALEKLVQALELPIIVKETGCGFGAITMQRLDSIGVAAIDISGLGGTHWGRIEGHRAKDSPLHYQVAQSFRNWGISTVDSMLQAKKSNLSCEIWGSGGVRHGLDAARLLALGAHTVGFAKPLLEPALESAEAVSLKMQQIEYELKVAMFCTGSASLADLKDKICL